MSAIAQRRVAGATALMILLYLLQVALFAPTAAANHIESTGSQPSNCAKVEGSDLGTENLTIEVDDHVTVKFHTWTEVNGDLASVLVDVTGLLPGEELHWQTKAGSESSQGGGAEEINEGFITENGTNLLITRHEDHTKEISHITLCVFDAPPGEATVSVSGSCAVVNGVAQFTYTVTASEGVTVDFDGGDQDVSNGGTYVSSSSSATWTATAPGGDLFPNEQSTTSGTASVTDCTPTGTTQGTTTTTTQPTTTTTEATTTTTEPEDEVLGTTITTVPEVSADTLPFTGSESGDLFKLAMLALAAGALMLFAVRGPKEEEAATTDIGGWSSL